MDPKEIFKDKIFTVSEFNEFVNSVLAPMDVAVEGEISDLRVSQNKFVWFNLKDKTQSLNCFSMVFRIKQPVEDGMKVKVYGYPKIYGKSGRFSFIVEKIEASGEGSLKRAYELLKTKLEDEGLFALERKRQIPKFPAIIGLITSPQAAAYSDFIKQTKLRQGGLKIQFLPVAVQGENAIREIVQAFDYFNKTRIAPDVLVLTRGGGSLDDLKEFNSEEVTRAVFSSKIPVICGIGHERDITLAELACDARASTPTHAAQLVVLSRNELLQEIRSKISGQLQSISDNYLRAEKRLDSYSALLKEIVFKKSTLVRNAIQNFSSQFLIAENSLMMLQERLFSAQLLLSSLSPAAILKRGYSIVKKNGKIVRTSKNLAIGDNIEINPHKGTILAKIAKLRHDKKTD